MVHINLYTRLGVPANARTHTPFDAQRKYVTSPLVRSPFAFAALRLLVAGYVLATLLVTLIWDAVKMHTGQKYFSYFTYLSYIGLCAYYFAAGTQTFVYALNARKAGRGAAFPLQRWPRVLQAMHVVLNATVVTFPVVVTIVFWGLLADPTTFETSFSAWSNLSVHAFNSVFALIEIFLSNSPPLPWITLAFTYVGLAGYIAIAYITHATQGFYTYAFLDPKAQGPKVAAYVVGIALAQAIVFGLVRGAMVLRERWAERTGRVVGRFPDVDVDMRAPQRVVLTPVGGEEGRESNIADGWEEVDSPKGGESGKMVMEEVMTDSDVAKIV